MFPCSRPPDHRDRRDRVQIQNSQWDLQYDRLVDTYLEYSSRRNSDGMVPEADPLHGTPSADIEAIDIFCKCLHHFLLGCVLTLHSCTARQRRSFTETPVDQYPNEMLIREGFLGCSPLHPTVAISIRSLALYRQTHRTCPRYSIEAQCKVLCHLHNASEAVVTLLQWITDSFTGAVQTLSECPVLSRL